MNILIVSYNWPPRNAMGTHRPYSWAREWVKHADSVTVLTAEKHAFDEPLDLEMDEIPNVEVASVRYSLAMQRKSTHRVSGVLRTRMSGSGIRQLKRVRAFIAGFLGVNVDVRNRWSGPAFARACGLIESSGIDTVVSSFGPESSHRIAARLKRRYPAVRWVADFRDLWSDNPTLNGLCVPLTRRIERRVCESADAMTTVSVGFADKLASLHQQDVTVVRNGFDIPMKTVASRLNHCTSAGSPNDGLVHIVYTGNYYSELQDPGPLFRAVRNLVSTGRLDKHSICISFYGSRLDGLGELAGQYDLGQIVKIEGPVSRNEALELQSRASALLLLEVVNASCGGVLPGKVYEYMASGSPVLCVGDGSDTELAEIIARSGTGVSAGADEEKIAEMIVGLSRLKVPREYRPDLEEIATFSRQASAQRMYQILEGAR